MIGYLALAAVVLLLVGARAAVAGMNIALLEVAGTAARATAVRGDATIGLLHTAIAWDCLFIGLYSLLLVIAATYFAPRAFRLGSFRRFAHTAKVLTAAGAALDLIENAAMWVGLARPGGDLPWQAAATVSWAKWLVLAVVILYALVGMATYLVTPSWVSALLLEPPDPNLTLTPVTATTPEDHVTGGTPDTDSETPIQHARFGIAASGGGIRSASLVLGSLQQLDRAYPDPGSSGPSWATADKVSSVSGGSYISGGFSIARSARRSDSPAPEPHPSAWRAEEIGKPLDSGTPEQRHLLGTLGYLLAPNPSGAREDSPADRTRRGSDVPGVVAMVVIGLILNAAVLFSLLWTLIQPYAWLLKSDAIGCRGPSDCSVQPYLVGPVVVWGLAAAGVLLIWVAGGWVRGALRPGTVRFRVANWLNRGLRPVLYALTLLTAVLTLALIAVPAVIVNLPGWLQQGQALLTPAAAVSGIGSLAAVARGLSKRTVRAAPYVAATLFVAAVVLVCAQWLIDAAYDEAAVRRFGLLVAGWLFCYLFVSAEWWSLAGFYRGRLRLAFATYRKDATTAEPYGSGNWPPLTAEPSVYELLERRKGQPTGSPLAICMTAHASTRDIRTHYGIPAMSVTVSPETVRLHLPLDDEGGWQAHQASTGLIEKLMFRRAAPRLTTMLAVGLSGAAVSPAMGLYRIGPARMLLAVANVRLGMWIPNPKYAARYDHKPTGRRPDRPPGRVSYPRPRLSYLLKEFFGLHDPNDLYLYLTDGGHWENTGLVELIRDRNIDEIVCLDADERPRETATEIAAAISLAKLECNADILLDLDVLRGPWDGRRGSDYSPQSVAVGVIIRGEHLGLLWYAKPVLTRDTPLELLCYAEGDATFPTTSTVDQFFHTAQFKAYRDLGRHNAAVLVKAREALTAATATHATYADFRAAAGRIGAHWTLVSISRLDLAEGQYAALRTLLSRTSSFAAGTP